jgi:SpoVK/Ycf46/Vps4 family AAA+-type ATPase
MRASPQLFESKHPNAESKRVFESLVGIDALKQTLVDELVLILDRNRISAWLKRHHNEGLPFAQAAAGKAPLILLTGEVGCGKTALASSVASAVGEALDERVLVMESPSDIRGSGFVGELSSRISDVFSQAARKVAESGRGILVIDEADDLATQRSQMQAHHEDRSGVNVLIKQIDQLARNKEPMAVILITNRGLVLDPAVVRRAALVLRFERPNEAARREVFRRLLQGASFRDSDLDELVALTAGGEVPYTFSDLTDRIGKVALRKAWKSDRAFGATVLKEAIAETRPSPMLET